MVAEAGSAALAEPRWHSNAAVAATLRNAAQFAQRRGQRSHLLSAAENATSLPRGCPKGARANYPMSNYPISVLPKKQGGQRQEQNQGRGQGQRQRHTQE